MKTESENRKGWEALLDDLEKRRTSVHRMGGPEKLAEHHGSGRLDARQRIDELVDSGTFVELGTFVGGLARGSLPAVPAEARGVRP